MLDYQDPWVGEWGLTAGPDAGGRPDFKSRLSRFISTRLEPIALRAANGVTAVSRATYEQALRRTPAATPTVTEELPIGWDEADAAFLRAHRPSTVPIMPSGDGLVHIAYVGTLLPTGFETLRALFEALARVRERDRALADRVRLHFFGTSNQRSCVRALPRVLPVATEFGVQDLVTEQPARLDYFDALQVLMDASAVLLLGSHEPHYTPSKVFPAMLSGRPLLAMYHAGSTATDLLRRFGGPPAVRLLTYDDDRPALTLVEDLATQIAELVRQPAVRRRLSGPRRARCGVGALARRPSRGRLRSGGGIAMSR